MRHDIERAEPEQGRNGQADSEAGPQRSPAREALDYARIERALRFVIGNVEAQPRLEDIADAAALSPFHFQRMFTRWGGRQPETVSRLPDSRTRQARP